MTRIGLISDTHALLRPGALEFLLGCDHIVHAGDIGPEAILDRLREVAPLTAVRGNNDTAEWAQALPEACMLELAGHRIYVLHDLKLLDIDPVTEGVDVVISGHTHRPLVRSDRGVLYVNPGSAGPRRFSLPIALGELSLRDGRLEPHIVELDATQAAPPPRSRERRAPASRPPAP
jgi:putative phosphoesterase